MKLYQDVADFQHQGVGKAYGSGHEQGDGIMYPGNALFDYLARSYGGSHEISSKNMRKSKAFFLISRIHSKA